MNTLVTISEINGKCESNLSHSTSTFPTLINYHILDNVVCPLLHPIDC